MIKFLFILFVSFIGTFSVSAANYITTENLFDNSYTNNLIDLAESQITNFNNKNFVILRNNYDYYLIAAEKKNTTINDNNLVLDSSDVIRAIRTYNGSYSYVYSHITENSSSVSLNHFSISNIDTDFSVQSKRYDEYSFNYNLKNIGIFVFGLLFAIFLLKGRSFYL